MCRSRPCSGGYMPRRGGLPRRCGFEGLQARNADGLQAYGNVARLTGMIDASLKIICYGRGVPNYFGVTNFFICYDQIRFQKFPRGVSRSHGRPNRITRHLQPAWERICPNQARCDALGYFEQDLPSAERIRDS